MDANDTDADCLSMEQLALLGRDLHSAADGDRLLKCNSCQIRQR